MKTARRYAARRTAWLCWMLTAAALMPGRAWAQAAPATFVALPLVSLEEQGAPRSLDCPDPDAPLAPRDPEPPLPAAAACTGAPLGFSAASGSGSRFGWFGMLGNFRYLVALPALLLVGGGGGGGGGGGAGAPGQSESLVSDSGREERPPYRNPVPEPASTVLLLGGALLVARAVRQRTR